VEVFETMMRPEGCTADCTNWYAETAAANGFGDGMDRHWTVSMEMKTRHLGGAVEVETETP